MKYLLMNDISNYAIQCLFFANKKICFLLFLLLLLQFHVIKKEKKNLGWMWFKICNHITPKPKCGDMHNYNITKYFKSLQFSMDLLFLHIHSLIIIN